MKIISLKYIIITFLFLSVTGTELLTQNPASPSNWIYPDGNSEAVKYNHRKSFNQTISDFKIKIVNNNISGDLQPLIGNLVDNVKISSSFPYAPNEIAVISGREIIILDGTGRLYKKTLENSIAPLKNISLLFDSTATDLPDNISSHVIMAFESIESVSEDTLTHTYLAGFDNDSNEIVLHKRLAIDMREYENIYNSIRPFYGKFDGNNIQVFSTLDIFNPQRTDTNAAEPPYLRGLTHFDSNIEFPNFPLPDIGDDTTNRIELAPRIGMAQPSMTKLASGEIRAYMPVSADTSLDMDITNKLGSTTNASETYLLSYNLSGNDITEVFDPINISDSLNGNKPFIRPYVIELNNGTASAQKYILLSEQYKGFEGSEGISKLHLLDLDGNFITNTSASMPSFAGDSNHYWSISAGDLDGTDNEWLPFYPNNPGKEIIVTQSSRNFAFPKSKIIVLKYDDTQVIDKPTPPNTQLFPFDTVCTSNINGWIAAVNDLDNADDNKEELIVVNDSKLLILQMRDYNSPEFRSGNHFDTLYVKDFDKESISSAQVADIEGDGLNDIIVTTHKAIYVIGSPLRDILELLEPTVQQTPPQEFCPGDSVELIWENKIIGQGSIAIDFIEVDSTGNNLDTFNIESGIANELDTVSFNVYLDSLYIGKSGYFIIKNVNDPEEIRDSSAIILVNNIEINNLNVSDSTLQAGDMLDVTGEIDCWDSLLIETKYLDLDWQSEISLANTGNTFNFDYEIPCLPIFSCTSEDLDSLLHFRITAYKNEFIVNTTEFNVKVRPADFPIEIMEKNTADPTQFFNWNPNNFYYICDTVSISNSYDNGNTFNFITEIDVNETEFNWKIPLDAPDTVLFRFCCESSCIRIDTLISGIKPEYIGIVSPNPFDPSRENVEFVYDVPESGNITIEILDEANRRVKTIVEGQYREKGITHIDSWDGRLSNGNYAANGIYYLYIEFPNNKREIYPIYLRR